MRVEEQIVLPIQDRMRASLEGAARDLRSVLQRIAKRTKQGDVLARSVGMDPGNFSQALKSEKPYRLDVASLPYFFYEDEDRELITFLCRLNGGQFVPDPKFTPEQRLENLARACRMSGAAGEAILRAAGEEP